MQDEEAFRLYLGGTHIGLTTGKIMSPRAISDCASRLRRAETVLGILAGPDLAHESTVRSLADRLRANASKHGLSEFAVRDCTVALRRYAEFQASKRRRPAKSQ